MAKKSPKDDKMSGITKTVSKLIAYQKGAVVSKTIIDHPTGTVTLFSFDRSQGLSEHKAPYDALVQIIDGEAEIRISGKAHIVRSGQLIILPANRPHALKANKRFKMLLTMIRS